MLTLGLAAWSIYAALTERVLIYSAGLFHQRGRSGERFAWSDIKHIERELGSYQGIGEISIKLTRSDDEEFELSGSFVYVPKTQPRVGPFQQFSLIDAVISIEEAVQSALAQKAITQYDSGAAVDFADVLVNQRGVQTKAGNIDWPAIADIEYRPGEFHFFSHGEEKPHLIVLAKTILNPFVFTALLRHIGPNKWTLTTRPDPVSERASVDAARRRRRRSTLISWVLLMLLFGGHVGYGKYNHATSRSGQLEHAQNLYADQRYDESIAVLDPLIAQEPGYVRGYIERGRAYQKLGQFDRSLSDYQQALILKPGYWYAIYNRGRLYDDMGRSDEALRDYTQSIALKPDSGNMYYRRGSLYARLGMKQAAISDLETYLTFPDDLGKHAEARQTLSELRR